MSEVKRYGHIGYLVNASDKLIELYPDMTVYVKAADLDRVTAERDAALENVESAEASAQTLHEVISRLKAERDALQALLTAADELADVLTQLLREGLEEYKDGDDWIERVIAALKTAEGGSYEAI